MGTIKFTTSDDFFAGILQLVENGLGFTADYDSMVITLTGAH